MPAEVCLKRFELHGLWSWQGEPPREAKETKEVKEKCLSQFLVASLLLVVRPGAPSSVFVQFLRIAKSATTKTTRSDVWH